MIDGYDFAADLIAESDLHSIIPVVYIADDDPSIFVS
jgi:hypothetical protein